MMFLPPRLPAADRRELEKAMKPEDLIAQIDETLSEARGESVEMTPAQFLAFVQAHTQKMDSDDAEGVMKRASYLIDTLDEVEKFADSSSVAITLFSGPESVQAQTAWRDRGERSVALVSGKPSHAFMEKAAAIKAALEAFVKANTEDEDGEASDEAAAETVEAEKAEADDKKVDAKNEAKDDSIWPLNFNAKEEDSKDDFFGSDPSA